jgi:hypothetical protein
VPLGQQGHVTMVERTYVADLKAQIIAAMKNMNVPMLMRVWQELEYRIDVCVCAVSPEVHISNISSFQRKTCSVFLWL